MKAEAPRCVVCGEPEPLGLSICPDCGGAAHAVGDTLLFVKPEGSRQDRLAIRAILAGLVAGRSHAGERALIAAGHQALIRIPKAAADRVTTHLASHGVPVRSQTARVLTWTSVPLPFYAMLVAMAMIGTWAAIVAEPLLQMPSVLVPLALLLAAQVRLQQPAIATPPRRQLFPTRLERKLIETFARLPAGRAHDLLAQLVRTAEPLYRTLRRTGTVASPRDVEDLVTYACQSATDLADLDAALDVLGDDPGAERADRIRTSLVGRFEQGIKVLYRLRAEAVDADPVREELQDLVARMDEETIAIAEARRELDAMLGDSSAYTRPNNPGVRGT